MSHQLPPLSEPWHRPGLMPAFALWWADHAPKATQAEAWDEWIALQSIEDGPPYDQVAMDTALKRERERCAAFCREVAQEELARRQNYAASVATLCAAGIELQIK